MDCINNILDAVMLVNSLSNDAKNQHPNINISLTCIHCTLVPFEPMVNSTTNASRTLPLYVIEYGCIMISSLKLNTEILYTLTNRSRHIEKKRFLFFEFFIYFLYMSIWMLNKSLDWDCVEWKQVPTIFFGVHASHDMERLMLILHCKRVMRRSYELMVNMGNSSHPMD